MSKLQFFSFNTRDQMCKADIYDFFFKEIFKFLC